jgi:hypothetical protein
MRGPIVGESGTVNLSPRRSLQRLPQSINPLSGKAMSDDGLVQSIDRAERAMERIERALSRRQGTSGRDEKLRARVRDVVAELDSIIEGAR